MIAVVVLGLILLMLTESFHAVATSKVHGENSLAVAQAARTIMLADERRAARRRANARSPPARRCCRTRADAAFRASWIRCRSRPSILAIGGRWRISALKRSSNTPPRRIPNHNGLESALRRQYSALLDAPPSTSNDPPTLVANDIISLHLRYFRRQPLDGKLELRQSGAGTSLAAGSRYRTGDGRRRRVSR